MKDIVCQNCKTLFGKEVNGVLTIKHRDLFRHIVGTVTGPCRRCGFEVKWSSDDDNAGARPTGQ